MLDALPTSSTGKILKHRWPLAAHRRSKWTARNATAAVVGAGDFIGAAIARRFAAEGYTVFAGRRNGDKLAPLVAEIEAAGGRCLGRSLDARKEEDIAAFLREADRDRAARGLHLQRRRQRQLPAPRDHRAGVPQGLGDGLLLAASSPAARRRALMLPRGRGSIFFTGATASLRGGIGYAAFASAKAGLRAVAQSVARELGPKNIHVAHLVIDAGVDTAWVRERIKAREGAEALAELRRRTG